MVGSSRAHKYWTRLEVTETYTLAYCGKEFNTIVKRFIVQDPWSLSYKPILEKIYEHFFVNWTVSQVWTVTFYNNKTRQLTNIQAPKLLYKINSSVSTVEPLD